MKKIIGLSVFVFGLLLVTGSVSAAPVAEQSASTADRLQPASTITYNEELVVNHTGRFNSVYIGKQDEGGVTFFNGTIVNSTTGDEDADNPVTFGDNVRIDGRVHRGEDFGPGDDMPFIINDDVQIMGNLTLALSDSSDDSSDSDSDSDSSGTSTLTVGDITSVTTVSGSGLTGGGTSGDIALSVSGVTTAMITNGTIATVDLADDAVTGAKIDADTNITAASYSYNTNQARQWGISGSSFLAGDDSHLFTKNGDYNWLSNDGDTTDKFFAPVNLPIGARVTELGSMLTDSLGSNFTITLTRRWARSWDAPSNVAQITTSDIAFGYNNTTTITNPTITRDYVYNLELNNMNHGGGFHRLYEVLIEYTVDNPLP